PADGPTGMQRRWAATGGNLGSVELYIAAADVAGLEAGVYFYQSQKHVLARLFPYPRREAGVDFLCKGAPTIPEEIPQATVVMAGAYSRVAQKYGAFAYRVVHLDAGVGLTQIQAVAGSLGLEAYPATHWDEKHISNQLDLIEVSELPTAV